MARHEQVDSPEFTILAAVLEPAPDRAIHIVPLSGAEDVI